MMRLKNENRFLMEEELVVVVVVVRLRLVGLGKSEIRTGLSELS